MILHYKRSQGVTLIELAVTLSIFAILISLAVPSWDQLRQKRHVTMTAEQLSSFLSTVQGTAVKHNRPLTVSLDHTGPTDWCVGAVLGSLTCDCTVSNPSDSGYCAIEGAPRRLVHEANRSSRMSGHSTDTAFTVEPVRGIMSPGDLASQHFFTINSKDDLYSLRVNISGTGRVTICSDTYSKQIPGYPLCLGVVIPVAPEA